MNKLEIVDEIQAALETLGIHIEEGSEYVKYWKGRVDGLIIALKNELEQEEKSEDKDRDPERELMLKMLRATNIINAYGVFMDEKSYDEAIKRVHEKIRAEHEKESVSRGTACVFEMRCTADDSNHPMPCNLGNYCITHYQFDCKGDDSVKQPTSCNKVSVRTTDGEILNWCNTHQRIDCKGE